MFFSYRMSHKLKIIEEELDPQAVAYVEPIAQYITPEQCKTLAELSRHTNMAISLVGDMMNRYQETMQILVPTLQQIQTLIQELQDGKKDIQ